LTSLAVEAVFVGRPAVLGSLGGKPVLSGFVKHPVAAGEVKLAAENLVGDEQADLSVHGGPDKAVYVYPSEHYPAWNADGFAVAVGELGENVSVRGFDESQVRLGDRWAWGTAELQVSQPRSPCFKLGMRVRRKEIIPAMLTSMRCGWYLRVLRTGMVPTTGSMTLLHSEPGAPTIADLHVAAHLRPDAAQEQAYRRLVEHALGRPELAASWRAMLEHRLKRL
jgi:MOSC domain-containing protein YiiM